MYHEEPLSTVTDSHYAERVASHIEINEFILDNTEMTLLFIQVDDINKKRNNPINIPNIQSHSGLPGPLAQVNQEIDQLLIGNVVKASQQFYENRLNSRGLKRDFSITGNKPRIL